LSAALANNERAIRVMDPTAALVRRTAFAPGAIGRTRRRGYGGRRATTGAARAANLNGTRGKKLWNEKENDALMTRQFLRFRGKHVNDPDNARKRTV